MKRNLVFILLVTLACGLQAVELGALLDLGLKADGRTAGTAQASRIDLSAQPSLIIKLDPKTQLEPFVDITHHSETDQDDIAAWGNNVSWINLGLGAGLYVFPLRAEPWSFGTGAKLRFGFNNLGAAQADVVDFDLSLDVPLIIELALTKNVHIRISHQIAGLGWNLNSSGTGPGLNQSGTFVFRSFVDGFNPHFGFSFYF